MKQKFRVVPISIPVSKNASDTAENASTGISKYAILCTDPIPRDLLAVKWFPSTSQLAQLALTVITYLKSIRLCRSKTAHRKLCCAATVSYFF